MRDFDSFFQSKEWGRGQKNVWEVLELFQWPKLYAAGDMVYLQGEPAERFYYLKKGLVKIFLCSENGAEKTLTLRGPGSVFGEAAFFDRLPRVSSARTMEKSEIFSVDRPALMDYFRREPELAMSMLESLSETVRSLSAQVDSMAFLQADRRIAELLLKLAAGGNQLSLTHEEIGSMAGVSRVTASKILGRFSKNGWITTHYRTLFLEDRKALEDFLEGRGD